MEDLAINLAGAALGGVVAWFWLYVAARLITRAALRSWKEAREDEQGYV